MADDLMNPIEPFKISESIDFQTAYLSDIWQISMMSVKKRASTGHMTV